MVSKSHKPVKECAGCLLNLESRCAAFEFPFRQWQDKDCEGYNNQELLNKYRPNFAGDGAHERKRIRVAKAKISHTIEHQDAMHQKAPRQGLLKKDKPNKLP